MSGPSNLDLFTRPRLVAPSTTPGGGAHWGRLVAALAMSCALHAVLVFMPALGRSAAVYRPVPRGAQESGPSRALNVRIREGRGPVAEFEGSAGAGAGPAGQPGRPLADEAAAAPQQLSRGYEMLPGAGLVFYTADLLTKRPEPMSRPQLDVPGAVARAVRGKVELKVWIDEFGNVVSVEVLRSNVPLAVSAVVSHAFRKLRYEPGEINGRPVPAQILVEVTYDNRLTQR